MVRRAPRRRRSLVGAAAAAGSGIIGLTWWSGRRGGLAPDATGADDDIRQAAVLAGVGPAEIQASTGGIHVVYHAAAPLPAPARPRPDGKITLVWFSATW